jgi:hypothetical protein
MTRILTLGAAAILFAAAVHHPARAQAPCSLLTPNQIKTVIGAPVQPGQPGVNDCTWHDAKGNTIVYLSLKPTTDFHDTRAQMQATGRLTPITGLAEDAFFVASTGTSAALYALKKRRVVLLTVDAPGYTRAQNEGAEKALATQLLPKL